MLLLGFREDLREHELNKCCIRPLVSSEVLDEIRVRTRGGTTGLQRTQAVTDVLLVPWRWTRALFLARMASSVSLL